MLYDILEVNINIIKMIYMLQIIFTFFFHKSMI